MLDLIADLIADFPWNVNLGVSNFRIVLVFSIRSSVTDSETEVGLMFIVKNVWIYNIQLLSPVHER